MSTLIANWADAREEINNVIDEIWDSYGFEINKDLVLRAYLLIFSNDIRFRVSNFSSKNAEEFEEYWDEIRNPDGHFKIPHLWPPQNPPPMNQNLAMDDKEAPEGTILFSSSSLLSDTRGGGKISGHKWGKLGGRPGKLYCDSI